MVGFDWNGRTDGCHTATSAPVKNLRLVLKLLRSTRRYFNLSQNSMSKPHRLVFVTGGTKGGLGFETARQLLALGHSVILSFRDAAKAEKAQAALTAEFSSTLQRPSSLAPRISWVLMDHMKLSSVRDAAAELRRRHAAIDVLMVSVCPDPSMGIQVFCIYAFLC